MPLIKSLALGLFCCFALNANAAIEQIYNWNGLEFVRSGNAHHVHPASPESTKLRGGWVLDISDVEPKATAKHDLPYANKGGALAKVTVTPSIDPKKISARVAQGLKNAAAGAATGNGYIAVGALACGLLDCGAAVVALTDWGIEKLKDNGDGTLSAVVPDPNLNIETSTGSLYYLRDRPHITGRTLAGLTSATAAACLSWMPDTNQWRYKGCTPGTPFQNYVSINVMAQGKGGDGVWRDHVSAHNYPWAQKGDTCPIGSPVVNGVCNGPAPTQEVPLQTYIDSRYTGKGWDNHWAKLTAAIVAEGGNVFTDGTSVGITGPAIVPVSVSETKTRVNVLPGTTTIAPSTHTGPTDSGTQTTTTTTSANNKFNPAPMTSSGSGSSGGPASGPSMTTTQTTTTTTSVTNNVTNITNITNETTTEKEEAPEEVATDTPLSNIPELYKQKYPDGLSGVWNSFKTNINQTSFVRLISELTPNIGSGGSCPVWTFDLGFIPGASMGVHRLGAEYCFIWPILKIILMITALFTARRLIFGG